MNSGGLFSSSCEQVIESKPGYSGLSNLLLRDRSLYSFSLKVFNRIGIPTFFSPLSRRVLVASAIRLGVES